MLCRFMLCDMCCCLYHISERRLKRLTSSVFFEHKKFKIIERNIFYETVFVKPDFGIPFEIRDVGIEPYRPRNVKIIPYLIDGGKYFMGACFARSVFDHGVPCHAVVGKSSRPEFHSQIIL